MRTQFVLALLTACVLLLALASNDAARRLVFAGKAAPAKAAAPAARPGCDCGTACPCDPCACRPAAGWYPGKLLLRPWRHPDTWRFPRRPKAPRRPCYAD